MDIKEYILDILNNDELLVRELISIDNKIQDKSFTYEELISIVKNIEVSNILLNNNIDVLTNGEYKNTLNILLNNYLYINNLYVDKTNLGVYSYIISSLNNYYNLNIYLDTSNDYYKYNGSNIVVSGGFEFNNTMKLELDRSTIIEA